MEAIEIDGSYGSGGGQVLRTSLGLSAVTGKPCRITNIRARRPSPGLRPQHLICVEAVARLCDAEVSGASLGSKEVVFRPGKIGHGPVISEVGTAGSVTLVLQALMIPAVHAPGPVELYISGGTHVAWSPTTGYFRHAFSEYMRMMGIPIESSTKLYGYYPKGGGSIEARVTPGNIKAITLEERIGKPTTEAWSNASRQLMRSGVGERQLKGAEAVIKIDRKNVKYVPSSSIGSSITMASSFGNCFLCSSALGSRGKPAEKVGEEAASELKQVLGTKATVDRHMADQIIPYMALAGGKSAVLAPEITEHTSTNIWVTEKFTGARFGISQKDGCFRISCKP
ncbi:MAG: RNA 3'-phosphate cyclase [Candidatus Aenigmatarchaeota archaeon]|nr:MAG: RNA 3'-phosphate cyclase [Candidatus Aenigmarchaeota archaeon]